MIETRAPASPATYDPGPNWQLRYWTIFVGQACSLIGSALTQFVLLWWITDTTGDISALAMAGLAALIPQALLGPVGGTLADAYSRRFLMIAADAVSAVCMVLLIALFLTDRIMLWHAYALMFVRSAMQAFQAPAAAASTAMLVPESFLPRAAGFNQTVQGIMTIAAAPLGALAISVMPIGWALGIDVVTAAVAIIPLLIFSVPQLRATKSERLGAWAEFKEGVRFVWNSPALRRLYALLTVVVVVVMPSFALVPLLVKEHFHGGAPDVAILEGLGGVGMVAGGLLFATIAPRRRVLWIVLGFAASCLALAFAALSPTGMLWLAAVWWFASGLAYVMGNAPLMTVIQASVPNQLQGRVLSLLTTVMAVAAPVGLAVATPLGQLIGIRWLFVLMGLAGMIAALLGLMSQVLRRVDNPETGLESTCTE